MLSNFAKGGMLPLAATAVGMMGEAVVVVVQPWRLAVAMPTTDSNLSLPTCCTDSNDLCTSADLTSRVGLALLVPPVKNKS